MSNTRKEIGDLTEIFSDKIRLIHFADSTKGEDGLPLGEGEIDFERVIKIFKLNKISIPVVVEVPEKNQRADKEKIEKLMASV